MSIDLIADERQLLDFVREQRWFGAREAEPTGITIFDQVKLGDGPARAFNALAEIRFGNGADDHYQLILGSEAQADGDSTPLARAYDAFAEPSVVEDLLALVRTRASIAAHEGTVDFCTASDSVIPLRDDHEVRRLAVEQSNSSAVVDSELFVKLYRRIEAGVNPELELLRFLAARRFANVPQLVGWWSYTGSAISATLGLVQQFLPGATDGWALACDEIASHPQEFFARIARLGEVIGLMHRALASDLDDPAFSPEESGPESLALLSATVDEEIEQVFDRLPADDDAVAPLIGAGDAVRDLLRTAATASSVGRLIRIHGDLHLGQVLWAYGDWFVIDFEGEPVRAASARRAKRSPLRDVAGMLRSFAYAVAVAGGSAETEQRLRSSFMDSYLAAVQPAGVLPAAEQIARITSLFELERAVYELRYELAHRPSWTHVPVTGIVRLLEQAAG